MALNQPGKNIDPLPQRPFGSTPRPPVNPPAEKKEGLFGGRNWASREDVRRALEGKRPQISGTSGLKYATPDQRRNLLGDILADPGKTHISRDEYQRVVKKLDSEKYRAKSPQEKYDIEQKIKYFREIGGI